MNKKIDLRKTLNIPNLLSLGRLVILPLILFLLISRRDKIAFVVLLVFWTTDALDGFLARRLNQETELGRILDPLVDKISIGLIILTLAITKGLPLWLAIAIVSRDVLILTGSLVIFSSGQSVVSSNIIGKITGFFFAGLIAVYILSLRPLVKPVFYITAGLVIISFINYAVRFIRLVTLKGNKTHD